MAVAPASGCGLPVAAWTNPHCGGIDLVRAWMPCCASMPATESSWQRIALCLACCPSGRGTVVCEGADPGNNVYGVCKGDQIVPTSGKLPGGSNIEIDPDSNETADKGATAESKGNAAAGSKPLVTTKPKIPKKTDVRDSLSQVPAGKADEDGSG